MNQPNPFLTLIACLLPRSGSGRQGAVSASKILSIALPFVFNTSKPERINQTPFSPSSLASFPDQAQAGRGQSQRRTEPSDYQKRVFPSSAIEH
ncbi:hypothetical protein AAC387_Pa02g1323 [Persea americana]